MALERLRVMNERQFVCLGTIVAGVALKYEAFRESLTDASYRSNSSLTPLVVETLYQPLTSQLLILAGGIGIAYDLFARDNKKTNGCNETQR